MATETVFRQDGPDVPIIREWRGGARRGGKQGGGESESAGEAGSHAKEGNRACFYAGAEGGFASYPGQCAAARSAVACLVRMVYRRPMINGEPYHDPTGDQMEYLRFGMIADKIEADPALLRIPLDNMERWLALGHHARREFAQWREWIVAARESSAGMKRLLDFLRDDSEEAREWKGYSPFAGILTKKERQAFLCVSMH